MALDILEDFCRGEKFKYLRLDGSMSQRTRQEGIDEFNREGSDVFLYMLTTRAGGAGINLWTADTVISMSDLSGAALICMTDIWAQSSTRTSIHIRICKLSHVHIDLDRPRRCLCSNS
jgi:hypothetical protein